MSKKITAFILLLLFASAAVFAIYRYLEAKGKENTTESTRRTAQAVVVNMVNVERKNLQDLRTFSGGTFPWSSFDVDPKVSGKLMELKFDIGDTIKRGDLIAKIDDFEYRQDVHQNEANLEYAKAKLKEAQGIAELRRNEFNRQKAMRQNQAGSISAYETAESTLKAQLATVEMCAADLKRCEAQLANARLKLSDTQIYADWSDGSDFRHVGERYVDAGSLINTGKPILNIVEIDRIKVRVPVIERDYRYLRPGQIAEICADAYPDRTFTGTVMQVGNTLSEQTRNATAVISIPNPNLLLRPGMFVRVKIILSEHENAQVVPLNAVVTKNGVQGVFGYDAKSETAEFIPVTTGLSDKKIIEITSPELTMPVITIGNHLLEDGKKVAISELSRREIVEKKYRQESIKKNQQLKSENRPEDKL